MMEVTLLRTDGTKESIKSVTKVFTHGHSRMFLYFETVNDQPGKGTGIPMTDLKAWQAVCRPKGIGSDQLQL